MGVRAAGGVRFRVALLLAGCFALHLAAWWVQTGVRHAVESGAYPLRVDLLSSGRASSLGEIARGRPMLVVFWTTWCAYCAEELRQGAGLVEQLRARPVPAEVLFVNVGEPRSVVARWTAAVEVADRIALDAPGTTARALGVRGFPTYVLIDEQGRPIWRREGLGEAIPDEVDQRLRRAEAGP